MLRRTKPKTTATVAVVRFVDCLAKTYIDGFDVRPGRTVVEHCQIVGEVAQALIARSPRVLQSLYPPDAAFAAACHDIGKVSPYFFEKLRRACTTSIDHLPALPVNPDLEREWSGHAGVSQIAAKAMGVPQWVPEILGQHHGFSPAVAGRRVDAEIFGGMAWQAQRQALVDELKQRLGMDWPQIETPAQARLVAGLTTVADWIGSGQHFENPDRSWQGKVEQALDEAGYIPPVYQKNLSFEQVFGFSPWPAQSQLVEAVQGPGVYVMEAPMGLGKTEAALYAAYCLLQQGQASGIYFALPTQLTSNKIYQRFNAFLERVLTADSRHRSLLLHGNAWLQETEMGEEGRPGGAWFNQNKRGLLAPFAVGTIDQALMAAMNVKHGFVRAFGLAGKVVILDEVHTYDAYTGTLLNALVELLRQLHCTVIILSATLSRQRRSELIGVSAQSDAYPLISAVANEQPLAEQAVKPPPATTVRIQLEHDEQQAISEALQRASLGQQVLWIENTVREAQQRYLDLASQASAIGVEHGLLHSRFTATDRQRIEARWVDLFGKSGWQERSQRGRILVGTQVLEQSLDIDADFLVSRFAPSDMLLQRLGRLWRHADTPRSEHAVCEAWLLVPQLETAIAEPYAAFGASAHVYSPYVLCRSLEVWQSRNALGLPQDIRAIIEQTYLERTEQGAMARWHYELEHGTSRRHGRRSLQQLARIGIAQDGKTLPESKAQTRYSETDSFEVLLLRDLQQLKGEYASRLILIDGSELILPHRRGKLSRKQWKQLTARLQQEIVMVQPGDAPRAVARDVLEKHGIQHCFYLGDPNWKDDESLLRIALIDEADSLRSLHGRAAHDNSRLEYRDDLGYRVVRL